MSDLNNQKRKVNSNEELQKMEKDLKRDAKSLFEPGGGIVYYETLKEMQTYFPYTNYSGAEDIEGMIFSMEKIRAFFLGLHNYNQAFRKLNNKGLTYVTINFEHRIIR